MKATELLIRDHQSIRAMLAESEDASCRIGFDAAQAIARLGEALLLHDRIEEEVFHPSLMASYPQERGTPIEQASNEHDRIRQLLREIAEINAGNGSKWEATFKLLKDVVQQHFRGEEAELIPKAERDLSEERLMEIGAHLEARKRQLENELKIEKC